MKLKKIKRLVTFGLVISMLLMPNTLASGEGVSEYFMYPFRPTTQMPRLTSEMYNRDGYVDESYGWHTGWDLKPQTSDETLVMCASGTVVINKVDSGNPRKGYGYYVVIEHQLGSDLVINGVNYGNKLYTLYGHMKALSNLQVGSSYAQGTVIGIMGDSGQGSGPHLHLNIGSEKTGGGFSNLKKFGKGVLPNGRTSHGLPCYSIMCTTSDEQEAAFTLDIIYGLDITQPENIEIPPDTYPEDPNDQDDEDEDEEEEEEEDDDGNPTPPNPGDTPPVITDPGDTPVDPGDGDGDGEEEEDLEHPGKEGVDDPAPTKRPPANGDKFIRGETGITDKEDIIRELESNGELTDYGNIETIEDATNNILLVSNTFSKVIGAIMLFVGVLTCGFKILLARGAAMKAREALLSGIGGVGVGFIIIGSAMVIVQILMNFMT